MNSFYLTIAIEYSIQFIKSRKYNMIVDQEEVGVSQTLQKEESTLCKA